MFGFMNSSLQAGKDAVLSMGTKMVINHQINKYGEMLKLIGE